MGYNARNDETVTGDGTSAGVRTLGQRLARAVFLLLYRAAQGGGRDA
jgi:hypothetical protein